MPRHRPEQYDVLLRIRKRQEDLRAQALASVRRERAAAEHERAEIDRQQRETLAEAATRAQRVFDAREVRLYYQYERHLAHLADQKDALVIELRGKEELRRQELEQTMKQRRIIEKLIERLQRAAQVEARKTEQKFADEVAGNYAARALRAAPRTVANVAGLLPEYREEPWEQVP